MDEIAHEGTCPNCKGSIISLEFERFLSFARKKSFFHHSESEVTAFCYEFSKDELFPLGIIENAKLEIVIDLAPKDSYKATLSSNMGTGSHKLWKVEHFKFNEPLINMLNWVELEVWEALHKIKS